MARNFRGLFAAVSVYTFTLLPAASEASKPTFGAASGLPLVQAASSSNSGKSYQAFLAALRHMESRGDYKAVNTLNFIGAYQFGEAALIDLGFVKRDSDPYDNNFSGGFTGKRGIHSVQDFLSNRRVQDKAAQDWMKIMWRYIENDRLARYAWTKVGDVTLTPSGMLAASHLLGSGGLRQFIESDGRADIRDPYGMPLVNYIRELAEYDVPFAPARPRVIAQLN